MSTNYNIGNLNLREAAALTERCIEAGVPTLWHGKPGIGKTDVFHELCLKTGRRGIRLDLPTMSYTDLRGMNFVDTATKKMVLFNPEWLPDDPNEKTILFLDELNAAAPEVQVAAYGFLHGRYRLPPGCYVYGAGNGAEDGASAFHSNTALASRLLHVRVQASVDVWVRWAIDAGIDSNIITCIRMFEDLLESVDGWVKSGNIVGPTPRGWANLSRIIKVYGSARREDIRPAADGLVGREAADKFFLLVEELKDVPTAADFVLLSAGRLKEIPRTLGILYGLVYLLQAYAKDALSAENAIRAYMTYVQADDHHSQDLVISGDAAVPKGDFVTLLMELVLAKAREKGFMADLVRTKTYSHYKQLFGSFLTSAPTD